MNLNKPLLNKKNISSPFPSFQVNLLSLLLAWILTVLANRLFPCWSGYTLACIFIFSLIIPIIMYEVIFLRSYTDETSGLTSEKGKYDYERLILKMVGMMATFWAVLLFYVYNPGYWSSAKLAGFFNPFFIVFHKTGIWILLFGFIYLWQVDPYQKNPFDSYWHLGCLITGRLNQVRIIYLIEHARVWFIKAFFIPIMVALLFEYLGQTLSFHWNLSSLTFMAVYNHLMDLFYLTDVAFGVIGYILTMRVLNNHIQSTDPTFWGWAACLGCYFPFSSMWGIESLNYEGQFSWDQWFILAPQSLVYFWGCTILILTGIYTSATIAFGLRMSNLTYRGMITSGPYRLTKHPAYLSKVLSWWMIWVPFFSLQGTIVAISQTLALAAVSLIYFLRARTEEDHLLNYPEYIQYAKWIDDHGVFRVFKKHFKRMRFNRSQNQPLVWFKKFKI